MVKGVKPQQVRNRAYAMSDRTLKTAIRPLRPAAVDQVRNRAYATSDRTLKTAIRPI